jgi:hypothetical protein
MKWLSVLLALTGCAVHAQYKSISDGPPRIEIMASPAAAIGQPWDLRMTLAGDENLLPFNHYTIINIYGDEELLVRGVGLLGTRFHSRSLVFSREYYLKRSPLSPSAGILDYDKFPTLSGIEEDDSQTMETKIHVEIWLAEEDFDGNLVPVKRVAKSRIITVKLTCVDCMY